MSQRGGIQPHIQRRSIKKSAAHAGFSPLCFSEYQCRGDQLFLWRLNHQKPTKRTKVSHRSPSKTILYHFRTESRLKELCLISEFFLYFVRSVSGFVMMRMPGLRSTDTVIFHRTSFFYILK